MKINQRALLVLLIVSATLNVWLSYSAYSGTADRSGQVIQDSRQYLDVYDPYIADARQRWSAKNRSSENPFRNRTTSVVTLDDRICVSFEYSQADIGGLPPFYCYSFEGVELISKRDDGE